MAAEKRDMAVIRRKECRARQPAARLQELRSEQRRVNRVIQAAAARKKRHLMELMEHTALFGRLLHSTIDLLSCHFYDS